VDYQDPIEVIEHLMIGSEGTLGFIAEITYNTVIEHPNKAFNRWISKPRPFWLSLMQAAKRR